VINAHKLHLMHHPLQHEISWDDEVVSARLILVIQYSDDLFHGEISLTRVAQIRQNRLLTLHQFEFV
jgi:hypothetical protein